jgi:hypothetical protein
MNRSIRPAQGFKVGLKLGVVVGTTGEVEGSTDDSRDFNNLRAIAPERLICRTGGLLKPERRGVLRLPDLPKDAIFPVSHVLELKSKGNHCKRPVFPP